MINTYSFGGGTTSISYMVEGFSAKPNHSSESWNRTTTGVGFGPTISFKYQPVLTGSARKFWEFPDSLTRL